MDLSEVRLIRSARRTVGIQITPEGQVVVRAPLYASDAEIRHLLEERADWIDGHLKKIRAAGKPEVLTHAQIKALADAAVRELPPIADRFAPLVGVRFSHITIRCQRTKWGSCSAKGNLNFNCLLMLTPPAIREYLVIHELCHLKQMNHSQKFWAEVARVCPDYKSAEKWLKANGSQIMRKIPEV